LWPPKHSRPDVEISQLRIILSPEKSASVATKPSPLTLVKASPSFASLPIPDYLEKTYWWAYLHPNAVRIFERQWLVNLILWGNFARLRDAALAELGEHIDGKVLQVACVYGDFTEHLVRRLSSRGSLDVIDVAPIQITNLQNKLKTKSRQVSVTRQDSTALQFEDASRDAVVVFFLLHEQPADVRRKTIAEALRVVKPGGKIIFVDYHRPVASSPFRYVMVPILTTLEPFAMDMWRGEISEWLPPDMGPLKIEKQTYFGGLYQKVVITKAAAPLA
jgi:ubiquinone/menaquinone biosynthesis C-methylase UbiE